MEIKEESKICSKCKNPKPYSCYRKFKRSKDGYTYSCNDCEREIRKRGDLKYRNKVGYSEVLKKSYLKNKDKRIKANIVRFKRRVKTDVQFRLRTRMRSRLCGVLTQRGLRKTKSIILFIGCTIEELKSHLEAQFKPDMTWDNYGKNGWEVDHIRPCVSFDLTQEEEQKKCFHYTNLQPLWKSENASKAGMYNGIRYNKSINLK